MTRIYVQRGSGSGSSSNSNRTTLSGSSTRPEAQVNPTAPPAPRDEEIIIAVQEPISSSDLVDSFTFNEDKVERKDEPSIDNFSVKRNEGVTNEILDSDKIGSDIGVSQPDVAKGVDVLRNLENAASENEQVDDEPSQILCEGANPPPPPVPPPKPVATSMSSRRIVPSSSNAMRVGSSKKTWPVGPAMSSPSHSKPSSPHPHGESEGYNSADEHNPCFVSSYTDIERERQFEIDIKRAKGLEVKRMLEDGNCLFRAVADQVYGDSEAYDLTRQMCIDYMERERDHFSQFVTEGFTSYCKRKRRDKVYGNNVEIQALAEMYSRPIHIYSYSTEPINIFQGSYITDVPIRLSYHQGNHYNSLIDPRRLTIGAGLGFSSLRGTDVGMDQVKAAIKAQQDQQIDNALLAEGRFYSDLELTEKEIERMVMDASRAEYLIDDKFKHQISSYTDSSTSSAEPSSSGAPGSSGSVLSNSMQMMLSMGFSYLQAAEAYSIFGDDVDSMVCYLVETGNNGGRRKGKATE
ncbi:unnamed protein product [Rhodiola kirilowii]